MTPALTFLNKPNVACLRPTAISLEQLIRDDEGHGLFIRAGGADVVGAVLRTVLGQYGSGLDGVGVRSFGFSRQGDAYSLDLEGALVGWANKVLGAGISDGLASSATSFRLHLSCTDSEVLAEWDGASREALGGDVADRLTEKIAPRLHLLLPHPDVLLETSCQTMARLPDQFAGQIRDLGILVRGSPKALRRRVSRPLAERIALDSLMTAGLAVAANLQDPSPDELSAPY